jgi:hypothetical protein
VRIKNAGRCSANKRRRIKGALVVFVLLAIALAAFVFLGRGGEFDVQYFVKAGSFLISVGLGTGLVGLGLLMLGRLAIAHFSRVSGSL